MYFRNHQLQFFLPWNSSDIQFLEGKKIDVPCFPILIDHKKLEQYGKAETKRMDFSNDQKIQNEKIKYSFSFGDFQKYSPEEIEKLNIDLKK